MMISKLILERIERIEQELQELKQVVETDLQNSSDETTDDAQKRKKSYSFADLAGAFPEFGGLSLEEIKKYEYKPKLIDY